MGVSIMKNESVNCVNDRINKANESIHYEKLSYHK